MMNDVSMKIIDNFLHDLVAQDRSEMTIKGYRSDLTGFAAWFEQTNGEAFSPELVTPLDVREYRQYLLNVKRQKPNTINRKLAALSVLMHWALDTRQIGDDPTKNVKSLQQGNNGPRWLEWKEQNALLRAIERDLQLARLRFPKRWLTRRRDASMVQLMLNTGLRLDEVLRMRTEDVALTQRKGEVTVRGKGRKYRTVPLNSEAQRALGDWLDLRLADRGDYIWVAVESEQDGPLSSRSVQRVVRRYGEEAGIENLTPHVLRHTFAKNLVDQGVGLEKVAALLGHSSLNTTRIYITPSKKDLQKAVETIVS
jgi:site-specific recombinase XerD